MTYQYQDRRPIEHAIEFIDAYVSNDSDNSISRKKYFTYHKGVFLSGVEAVSRQTNRQDYMQYIDLYLACVLDENKFPHQMEGHFWASLDSLDFRQPGILMFRKYFETQDKRYLNGIAMLVESLTQFPRNSYGGFWHMKSQPNQMWLDGLYMVGPICAQYAVVTGKREFGELALRQAVLMYEHMCDQEDGLLFHGWDDSKEAGWADQTTGLSKEKWGRALGWFVVASADIVAFLDDSYEERAQVIENLKKTLSSLLKVQREDGFWCQVIDKPEAEGNWPETSCTCLIAAALAKAYRLGIVGDETKMAAQKAFEGVIDSLQIGDNGQPLLSNICIGTCIDEGTYEHYIARDTCVNDLHGSGAYLLMCAELNLI